MVRRINSKLKKEDDVAVKRDAKYEKDRLSVVKNEDAYEQMNVKSKKKKRTSTKRDTSTA